MGTPDLVIQNVRWLNEPCDLLVAGGKILELAPHGEHGSFGDAEIVDGRGMTLLPSLVDAHVHLRDPGQEYKEDIASGLKTAAHGGVGHVMCMANTSPVNDDASITEAMLRKARAVCPNGPKLWPVGALSKGLKCKELAEMADMKEAGCVAFSNDGLPVENTEFFRHALEYADTVGAKVIDHCEDPYMYPGAGMNEGAVSSKMGLRGQPWAAEAIQVARDILLAEYLKLPIHLAHVSCKASIDLIAFAKKRGVKVTAETCPHYLFFTEGTVAGYNTGAKVNPPLRTKEDVEAMRRAIDEGVIDIVATDHAPHADYEKEVEFMTAPCGISGLDTALSLMWKLVDGGLLDQKRLVELMSWKPGEIFGLPVNRFQPGDPADFVLFDHELLWEVTPESMHSKSKNTPCLGMTLKGRVAAHYMGGVAII